jgi:hypothetical protein
MWHCVILRCLVLMEISVIRLDVLNTSSTIFSLFVTLCGKLDLSTHKGMHSVLALKLSVTKLVIRVVLTVGCKPRIDWTFLMT